MVSSSDCLGTGKKLNNGISSASVSQLWQCSCYLESCIRNYCWFISQGSSKTESACSNNFLTALCSFLKQHRKRKKTYYRSIPHFFLELLYSIKSPFYDGYQTIFPQSTDLFFQSNQIRMDIRIGYVYWYFH